MKELYILEEDYKDWKINQEVYVVEKFWPHRDFGVGTITGFEINEPYSTYRIRIDLKHDWFDDGRETFFPPYDVFRKGPKDETYKRDN